MTTRTTGRHSSWSALALMLLSAPLAAQLPQPQPPDSAPSVGIASPAGALLSALPQSASVGEGRWIPVFMLDPLDAGGDSSGVLVGLAQVQSSGLEPDGVSVSPSLRWRLGEDMAASATMTVTDFVPCRSLLQQNLTPLRMDACEAALAASHSQGSTFLSGRLDIGAGSVELGYGEGPVMGGLDGPSMLVVSEGGTALPRPVGTPWRSPLLPIPTNDSDSARTFSLGGELRLSPDTRMGMALALSQLPQLENSPDMGRMRLSFAHGNLSANLGTQVVPRPWDALNPFWAGLDLGMSWRTPWSGVISVGARNLVTTGKAPKLRDEAEESRSTDAFARTPYVRYEQDF